MKTVPKESGMGYNKNRYGKDAVRPVPKLTKGGKDMYDDALLLKLLNPGKIIESGGCRIEVKDVPDPAGENKIDPRFLEMQMSLFKMQMERPAGGEVDLEGLRNRMGGFTPNLCRTQIRTRYLEADGPAGPVPVWVYYPRYQQDDAPALIYVHGGGFYIGSAFDTENVCRLLAEHIGGPVFNVDYSLAPEQKFPVQPQEVYAVLELVSGLAEQLRFDPQKLYAAGDSAGGNLAAALAVMDRAAGQKRIVGQILIYPVVAFTHEGVEGYDRDFGIFDMADDQKFLLPSMTFFGSDTANEQLLGYYANEGQDPCDPRLSPYFADPEVFPPTMIVLSEYDGLRPEGECFAAKLGKAGVPYKVFRYRGMGHGFFDKIGQFPQSEAVVREIAGFIRRGRLEKGLSEEQKKEAAGRVYDKQAFGVDSY